jgi:hypothetical protein
MLHLVGQLLTYGTLSIFYSTMSENIFRRLRKVTKNANYLRRIRLSVRMYQRGSH